MTLAPEGKRQVLAQSRYDSREQHKRALSGRAKQKAWQARKQQEAASRLDSRLRSEMGKEGYVRFLETASVEEFDRLIEQEMYRGHVREVDDG